MRLRAIRFLLIGICLFAIPVASLAADSVPMGMGDFVFADERGNADKPIRVWTYRPDGFAADSPIVFVMHGMLRNGETYRQPWIPLADQYRSLIVVPEFSLEHYFDPSTYQFGNLCTKDGQPIEESKWTFSAVEHLFDHLKSATGNRSERYYLFGHSAGSQFVHRMVLFKTGARIARAVTANAGCYTMPCQDVKFPFGLADSNLSEARLRSAFGVQLLVLLGEKDTDPNDKHLPQNPEALAQGPHRFERGQNFFRTAETEAKRLEVPLQWKLAIAPDIGHDNFKMAPIAAKAMFETRLSGGTP